MKTEKERELVAAGMAGENEPLVGLDLQLDSNPSGQKSPTYYPPTLYFPNHTGAYVDGYEVIGGIPHYHGIRVAEVEELTDIIHNAALSLDLHQRETGQQEVIDQSLGPIKLIQKLDEKAATAVLDEGSREAIRMGLTANASTWNNVAEKSIPAVTTFVAESKLALDDRMPYEDYVKIEAGYDPSSPEMRITQDELDMQLERMRDLLEGVGEDFNRNDHNSIRSAYQRWQERRYLHGSGYKQRIIDETRFEMRRQAGAIERATGYSLSSLKSEDEVAIKIVEKNEPWTGWAAVNQNLETGDLVKTLSYNFNPRQRSIMTLAAIDYLSGKHELTHLVTATVRMQRLAQDPYSRGSLHRIANLYTIPAPHHVVEEGLAQTIDQFIPEYYDLSIETRLYDQAYRLGVLARARAIQRIELDHLSIEEALAEALPYIYVKAPENFRKDLENGRDSAFWRGYLEIYGNGDKIMRKFAEDGRLNKQQFVIDMTDEPRSLAKAQELYRADRRGLIRQAVHIGRKVVGLKPAPARPKDYHPEDYHQRMAA